MSSALHNANPQPCSEPEVPFDRLPSRKHFPVKRPSTTATPSPNAAAGVPQRVIDAAIADAAISDPAFPAAPTKFKEPAAADKDARLKNFERKKAAEAAAQQKAAKKEELRETLEQRAIVQFRKGLNPFDLCRELERGGFKDLNHQEMKWWQIAGELENDPNTDEFGCRKKVTSNWCKTAVAKLRAQKVITRFPHSKQARQAAEKEAKAAERAGEKLAKKVAKLQELAEQLRVKAEKKTEAAKKAKGAKQVSAKAKASHARMLARQAATALRELEKDDEVSDSDGEAEAAAEDAREAEAAFLAAEEAGLLADEENPELRKNEDVQASYDERGEQWKLKKRKCFEKRKAEHREATGEESDSD